jgi:hypothetical protein
MVPDRHRLGGLLHGAHTAQTVAAARRSRRRYIGELLSHSHRAPPKRAAPRDARWRASRQHSSPPQTPRCARTASARCSRRANQPARWIYSAQRHAAPRLSHALFTPSQPNASQLRHTLLRRSEQASQTSPRTSRNVERSTGRDRHALGHDGHCFARDSLQGGRCGHAHGTSSHTVPEVEHNLLPALEQCAAGGGLCCAAYPHRVDTLLGEADVQPIERVGARA